MRRAAAGLCALPLIVAGSLAAHAVAYRVTVPEATQRGMLLEETGHGYLDHAPLVAAAGLALCLVAFLLLVLDARGGGGRGSCAAWPFAVLPLLGFAIQEHLERFLHDGGPPWTAVLAPTFLPGLLLQVPFGLLAFLLARVLLRAAERIGRALRTPCPAVPGRGPKAAPCPRSVAAPSVRPLAACAAGRAPPAVSG
jgi:hypothetical protein